MGGWWTALAGFFAAPLALVEGSGDFLALVAVVGVACLVLGVISAILLREGRALWMAPLIVCATLTTMVIGLAQSVLGWLGIGFVIAAGAIMLPILTHLVARDATQRAPVWMLGVFAYALFVVEAWRPLMTILGVGGA